MTKAVVLFLLAAAGLAAQPSALNVSHDLTALNIGPPNMTAQNMTPNMPALDSRPLLEAAVAYATSKAIGTVTADPNAYYFLTGHTTTSRHLDFSNLRNVTVDLAGSDLYFQLGSWTAISCTNCQGVQLQNFTVDTMQLPFTQLRVTSVDVANSRVNYAAIPGWEPATNFNSIRNPSTTTPEPLYAFGERTGK